MKQIKQSKRAAKYLKKPSKELKNYIKVLLKLKIKRPSQLAREYGIPKSTIYSYLNAKGPMYQPLEDSIFQKLKKRLVMGFQTLSKYKSDRQVMKDITFYLQTEEFFQFTDSNPFSGLIPLSKQNSQRSRSFRRVRDLGLAYFKYLQTTYPPGSSQEQLDELIKKECEEPQGGEEPQVDQDPYQGKEQFEEEIRNQIPTEQIDSFFLFGNLDSFSYNQTSF
ncbi:unnamed protein product (macronuclear) [Paramecium tetraurelia]|uniref:HTH psq-type domain-containing protein n=1 Tax=Paramecium tetraurelia TaxID=5888 RepID=A0BCD1_PARTE|nr:uncharacterized protein GSPATT00004292001 [Paramecium tetraurelia]CAK56198.1 unnamed protein product [Paramecium tetraurelia]|eukprot:XP_001423596.1 hypothetical protein (macronuclear) [Paramecium tetraurelia strain d4-2]